MESLRSQPKSKTLVDGLFFHSGDRRTPTPISQRSPLVKTTTRFSCRMLGVAVAASSLIVLATGTTLIAAPLPLSDELLISVLGAAPPPLFDAVIAETAGPGTESSALFAPGTGLGPLIPPGGLAGLIPAGGVPGATFVILTEPAGEPVDPGELPPVMFPGPNGVVVSDVLVNGLANQAGLPPFIAFVSDNNPDLARIVPLIPPGSPVLAETGLLQDLTALIGPAVLPGVGPLDVQVRSTVPEPSSIVMLLGLVGTGLIGLTWHRRRPA
jgi:PEP-CTERM motif